MNANAANFDPKNMGYANPSQSPMTPQYGGHGGGHYQEQPVYNSMNAGHMNIGTGTPTGNAVTLPTAAYRYGHGQDPTGTEWDQLELMADPSNTANGTSATANGVTNNSEANAVPGTYFQTDHFTPSLHGAPVSALAYDHQTSAIYVASHTQRTGDRNSLYDDTRTMGSLLVAHSTTDGMLYSSCVGHPQADSALLHSLSKHMYGGSVATAGLPTVVRRIPPHAYVPPYGTSKANTLTGEEAHKLGIQTLLPFSGYVASVSPAAVRVHSQGGLLVSDQNIQGMVKGCPHPGDGDNGTNMTHITVGGVPWNSTRTINHHLHCMDLYQNLKIISSHGLKTAGGTTDLAVTALATNHEKNALVAGCTDGTIRVLDGSWRRGGIELAKVKSHAGGVTDVAVSDDGILICTAGYSARPNEPSVTAYAFPDQFVYIYDTRFLGRGGIVHPFSGMGGAPRLIKFLPNYHHGTSDHTCRILACSSGRGSPGLQFITPFEPNSQDPSNFFSPFYTESDEFVTDMCVSGPNLALGTSMSNITQFQMAAYETTTHAFHSVPSEFYPSAVGSGSDVGGSHFGSGVSARGNIQVAKSQEEKVPLVMPSSYTADVPALSIEPSILQTSTESIFNKYVLCTDPKLTPLYSEKDDDRNVFGPLSKEPILVLPKRTISEMVTNAAVKREGDYMAIVKTDYLNINLLHQKNAKKSTKKEIATAKRDVVLNPNRLLHCKELSAICYDTKTEKSLEWGKRRSGETYTQNDLEHPANNCEGGHLIIPRRYRCTFRPTYVGPSSFDHTKYNGTGLWPGWEYPPTALNATVPSVLLMLYFVPEVRSSVLNVQRDSMLLPPNSGKKTLSEELSFLFYQIDTISAYATTYPEDNCRPEVARVGAFVPYNFLAYFASMPEAESLALLDGAPAATTTARRPEAFYRFLLHHLDKELSGKPERGLMDDLYGLNLTSINEFLTGSGPPTVKPTRERSVDLAYEPFIQSKERPSFGEVLRHALCKESQLRAWCQATQSYETVIQRKVATSLPVILSLCCSCGGNTTAKDRLPIWRTELVGGGQWLPEIIEVELESDGNVVVKELKVGKEEVWETYRGKALPLPVSSHLTTDQSGPRKIRYKLDSVLSFVRDDMAPGDAEQKCEGHHVLQVRIPRGYKKRALNRQLQEINRFIKSKADDQDGTCSGVNDRAWTLNGSTSISAMQKRSEHITAKIDSLDESFDCDWITVNGFVVSETPVEDVRDFHSSFKEPSLVTYRAVSVESKMDKDVDIVAADGIVDDVVPFEVIRTQSISTGKWPKIKTRTQLPGKGDLVAFDAEFVQVQQEESVLTDTGSKVTVREARNTLARISLIDCRNNSVIIDDYILPREPVVDYLTRFSGIVAKDLHPKHSPHHLITMRSAYLTLRLLLQNGCIFVGHGLGQDFLMVNLYVPPAQIIDTVEIFHKDRMRYISLRFLANCLLGQDMQQDTHDSIEDADMAYHIFCKALTYIQNGTFDKVLNGIYEYGQKTDWKLGIHDT